MSKTDYDLYSMLGNKSIAAELKHNSVGIKELTVFSDKHIGAITKEKNARNPLKIGPLFFLRGGGGVRVNANSFYLQLFTFFVGNVAANILFSN